LVRRRGRDLNPRGTCAPNGFRDRRIRPLCHPSAVGVQRIRGLTKTCEAEKEGFEPSKEVSTPLTP
jgi:hypothetical protein